MTTQKDTVVLNLFGGPGIGKSSTAAGLFFHLKKNHFDVELTTEFAKEVVWDQNMELLYDQIFVFANQNRRVQRMMGKVDYVVTDSPTILVLIYAKHMDRHNAAFDALVTETFKSQRSVNFFLKRDVPYDNNGRYQTEEAALEIDHEIEQLLIEKGIEYHTISITDPNFAETILDKLSDLR